MAIQQETLAFSFGLLGNIVSFITFLAPMPTFYQIYKRKSTEGFQSIPYLVSLLSAMLLIYYGFLKSDILLITINGFGCFIETAYLVAYLVFASRNARMETMKIMVAVNMLGYGTVLAGTMYLADGEKRVAVLGWICMVFSLCVFAAPLCIMRKVIKTKSVEFMPLPLSLFLTLGAVVWFFYGFFKHDYYIAVPNILGLVFGLVQIALYFIYKKAKKLIMMSVEEPNNKLQELPEQMIDVVRLSAVVCPELNTVLRDITESFAIEVGQVNATEVTPAAENYDDDLITKETELQLLNKDIVVEVQVVSSSAPAAN